ncbi:MAG: YfcE family phosphodiesterase [Planctomycetota bacterium]
MKVGVISDSHDHVQLLQQALQVLRGRGADVFLHAGDLVAPFSAKLLTPDNVPDGLPVHVVYGNNDGERDGLKKVLPQIQDGPLRVELGGRTFVMHHALDWITDSDCDRADVVIGGHTHEIINETRDGILHLNPGECCGILSRRATAALVDTEELTAEIVDLR